METSKWIAQITTDSVRDIAKRTGISERTLHHQVSNNRISLENIVKVAVAYSRHPMSALIEWGYVSEDWSSVPDIESALRLASEDQLADEVLRRMKLAGDHEAFNTPVDDLAARRNTPDVQPFDQDLAVADSSPDHPEEDTDFD